MKCPGITNRLLCAMALLAPLAARGALVQDYGSYPGETQGTEVTVTVDGAPVFVHTHNGGGEGTLVNYVHFSFTGSSQIRVTASTMVNDVRPKALGIPCTKNGNTLAFTIDKPFNYVVLRQDDRPPNWYYEKQILVCIFAEEPMADVPSLADATVHSARSYGIDSTGVTVETQKINAAISAISTAGGGTLFFPRGIYTTGTVNMKSNVQVWVDGEALVRASTVTTDFPAVASGSVFGNGSAFFYWNQTVNARLRGHGVLDMRRSGGSNRPLHQMLVASRNSVLEGITISNSREWTVHPIDCDSLIFRNVRVMNREPCCYVDQFDIDASREVLLENCFSYGGDDATAIKCCTTTKKIIRNFVVRNSTFWSTNSNGLRVGGGIEEQNWTSLTNVLYDNVHFLHAGECAVRFMLGQTGLTRDLRFLNCSSEDQHMDILRIVNECWNGCSPSSATVFRNAFFDNFVTSVVSSGTGGISPNMTMTYGDSIRFNCLKVNGSTITAKPAGYTITATNVQFGCTATKSIRPELGIVAVGGEPIIRGNHGSIVCVVTDPAVADVVVLNLSGSVTARRRASGPGSYSFDLSGSGRGVYIVECSNSTGRSVSSSQILLR